MKRRNSILALSLCLLASGCASSAPPVKIAAAPVDPAESIHTLIRKIHLDYGNQIKAEQWNEVAQGPLGASSTESIRFGKPVKTRRQLNSIDALASANSNRGDRSIGTRSQRPNGSVDLHRQAKVAEVTAKISRNSFAELDRLKIEVTIENYCNESSNGQIVRLDLNAENEQAEILRPLDISDSTRKSQYRILCITGDDHPYRSPFIVDLFYEFGPDRRMLVHYSGIVLSSEAEKRIMDQLDFADSTDEE